MVSGSNFIMPDLTHQNIATVQNLQQPKPVTIASATTIAPSTFMTLVTGTTNVAQITPPVTGSHLLTLVFTDGSPGQITTTGNVLVGTTTITQNRPVLLFYDPAQARYYVGNVKAD
jgi:hypothetical protein